jgi:hypothetical protein
MTGIDDDGIHLGDVGTLFKLTIKEGGTAVNISGAVTKTITFRKPDKTTVSKTALFFTDGADGILTYTSIANDLDQSGEWAAQAVIDLGTWSGKSEIKEFRVYPNL